MVTLPHEAMKQALEALYDGVSDNKDWMEKRKRAITALRQALEADAKPCSCCGDGNTFLSVTRICDTCGSEYAGQAEFDLAKRLQAEQQAEPVAWMFEWTGSDGQHCFMPASNSADRLRLGQPPLLGPDSARTNWKPLYTNPQPTQQLTIPPGYKLVPVEPNMTMTQTALNASRKWSAAEAPLPRGQELWASEVVYGAMLAAAPEAPATGLNLNCKSEQKRLATLWGFVPAQQPLTDEQIFDVVAKPLWSRLTPTELARAIERAHGIK